MKARLRADLHIHTNEAEPFIAYNARDVIARAAREGYRVLSITNHDTLTFSGELAAYARDHGIVLIPGVEATVEGRHVLVYNADVAVDKLQTFADLRRVLDHRRPPRPGDRPGARASPAATEPTTRDDPHTALAPSRPPPGAPRSQASASARSRKTAKPGSLSVLLQRSCATLGQVEHQHLGGLQADEAERGLRADGGAVTLPEGLAVERHGAARDLHPSVALGVELMNHLLVALEQHGVETDILLDGHGRAASPGPGDQAQRALLVQVGDRLLLVARLRAAPLRDDPDLEEMNELGLRGIELAVGHAGARAHPLDLTGPD